MSCSRSLRSRPCSSIVRPLSLSSEVSFARHLSRIRLVRSLLGIVVAFSLVPQLAAQVVLEQRLEGSGTIQAVRPGVLRLRSESGESIELKYQGPEDKGVSLAGAQAIITFPATIVVRGSMPPDALEAGQTVAFQARLMRGGKLVETPTDIELLSQPDPPSITPSGDPAEDGSVTCRVVGEVLSARNGRIAVTVDRSPYSNRGRLAVPVEPATRVRFVGDRLDRATVGDQVTSVRYARFSTGDFVIEAIEVERRDGATLSAADELEAKFREFSDEPSAPRDVRSRNFLLHTDISDRQAQILLFKLESMIDLVSRYFGRPSPSPIECFVVRDMAQWPAGAIDPVGAAKIANGEGVTISQTLGRNTRSIVYSCDSHGVVQHEAMHAYCAQSFGSTGPTWYSEGVAEMGQYWKDGELAVSIDPVVADYLMRADPKKELLEIVAAGQVTGDSWQAYAWRWALCHLLANNPNYNGQFKALGIAMMSGQPESFESAYGTVAPQISFEYDQFVRHVANGYRADLCAWQWNRRFTPLRAGRKVQTEAIAQRGWQATGLQVEAGATYAVGAEGTWKVDGLTDGCSADGEADGRGRLVAVVMTDFQLSEEFELGAAATFVPPASGDLYVRCREDWTGLADNAGELKLTFSRE